MEISFKSLYLSNVLFQFPYNKFFKRYIKKHPELESVHAAINEMNSTQKIRKYVEIINTIIFVILSAMISIIYQIYGMLHSVSALLFLFSFYLLLAIIYFINIPIVSLIVCRCFFSSFTKEWDSDI